MAHQDLAELAGTDWVGEGELWLDPLGNEGVGSKCTMSIGDGSLRYTWTYEGKTHEGNLSVGASPRWSDTWHQQKTVELTHVPDAWGLFAIRYSYPAGEGPDWGWRMQLAKRPSGELVLQMTNITPWGEEGRAVRMIFTRA